ncbi:MAG: decaprenyl-phosphate phosphoribosyltransferase [Dehalococcoidia bacterium]|jgi:4-hydroxybenzoate polyprenyltransferase|nr:decaprenyl-phosphate phosphoribosyltransferase [Dehalococcoidia bacterium]MDP6227534.1 decaprenyl-phosphate phosphoribosyltransferase [Dehalococcoidia bacterium]MDP7083504.1 decaprenyl-phosphate phosphoribosyltransferase [Dehalococcoidia bacterium]MDP7199401.1 decaprenyl-phosphate phosphoribosyltransferase [Dehalococcoidia bacterium]MDP7509454.1 decaprenyl-phosphate phosphoribosyltransferase [Dehalococcoidia bacterium]
MEARDKFIEPAEQSGVASQPTALLKALRPKQWIRNGLVFFPLVFSVQVAWSLDNLEPVPGLIVRLLVLLAAFCALSSAVYLFNDLADREADRQHPVKRFRPIASGKVGVPLALAALVTLAAAGLAAMFLVEWVLGVIGLIYLAINMAYSVGVKQVVLLDVLAVASGYVIRVVAGAVAIGVTPSPWLYVTTAAGALFIVLGRRYAEVRLAGDSAAGQRPVLSKYAGAFIGQCIAISATAAWLSYALYTVEAENLPENNTMLLTLPLVTFGLFRYLYLLNTSREAETPEQLIVKDIPLVLSILCWMGVSALVLLLN